MAVLDCSLFDILRHEFGIDFPIVRCTKATLVHLSHTFEDLVLRYRIPALLFTGFQESSHWREETERYRALADVAQQVCIFACGPLPPEANAKQLHVRLNGDDPLRQEWFVIILSKRFAVLLCGQDRNVPAETEALRQFDTLWSFEPALIDRALDRLEQVIVQYRPERLEQLRQSRRTLPPPPPDAAIMTAFSSEMIRYEEQLRAALHSANHVVEEQLRWREQVTEMIIHDLHSPLQSLMLTIGALNTGAQEQNPQHELTRLALQSVEQMSLLVHMLLTTNQLETHEFAVTWQPVELRPLILQAVDSMRVLLQYSDMTLEIAHDTAFPTVWGDSALIVWVFQNLISNAVKHSGTGDMIVIDALPLRNDGMLEVCVRDIGVGIDVLDLPHVFERYYRSNKRDRRGTGIGLYFCRLAIETLGGSITAASAPGAGTTITVAFRLQPPK
jgi:signal transduction histidine kinase